jgi:hypothetical protein
LEDVRGVIVFWPFGGTGEARDWMVLGLFGGKEDEKVVGDELSDARSRF